MDQSEIMAEFDKIKEGILDLNIKYGRFLTYVGRNTVRVTYSGMDPASHSKDLKSIQTLFHNLKIIVGAKKNSIIIYLKGPAKGSVYNRGKQEEK